MSGQGGISGGVLALITIDATMTGLMTVITGVLIFLIKRRSDRESARDALITSMSGDVRSLREGMSLGAREAITHVTGRLGVLEDAHEQLSGKVIELRADQRATDRAIEGHIRAPRQIAHPESSWGPQVG